LLSALHIMPSQTPSHELNQILVVDDMPENLRLLADVLTARQYRVRCAKSATLALRGIQAALPNLILLDIDMPDMSGYDLCRQLKSNAVTREIPVIFLSALDDVLDKVKAFEVGGADYVRKPFHIEELVARIQHQLNLQAATIEIQRLNCLLEQRVQQRTAELEATNLDLKREISERQKAEEKLLYDALHDSLTQLPNRVLFMERVENALRHTRRHPSYKFAVLFIDLDRFKIVNDSLGHAVGDQLLVAIARQVETCLREADTVARLGGDEFTVLLEDIEDIGDAVQIAERIQDSIKSHFCLEGHRIFTSASIGIAVGSAQYEKMEDILRDADIAMYRAKEMGRSCHAIFDQDMYYQTLRLLHLESDLRQALEHEEFLLHYQPIVSLTTGKLSGFEALVRWEHPKQGFVSPVEFIPLAEDTGLIVPLGEWVLRQACWQMRQWQLEYPEAARELKLSVNLAGKQLQESNLVEKIDEILVQTKLPGESLRLELTESTLMERTEEMIRVLQEIRDRRIQLSIDDFGTGYSSLSYLHRFPVTTLKIDRSFVSNMSTDPDNFEIVRTVIALAHTLSMEVVAEGVETLEQSIQLRSLGCELSQGYLFSRPLDRKAAELLLKQPMCWDVGESTTPTVALKPALGSPSG
jgi:diguanylate cyclase (GGDEF)-like protein